MKYMDDRIYTIMKTHKGSLINLIETLKVTAV